MSAPGSSGICSPPQPAVIREKNDPPTGTGVAIASHIYKQCGTDPAACTVVDDDGGVGMDTAVIRVVDVRNKGFEDGFRERVAGAVGNAWKPYWAQVPVYAAKPAKELDVSTAPLVFFAEEYPVHSGERSQHIRFDGQTRFGIRQQVGANEGWDYQITGWYSLAEKSNGSARLGIDRTGGTDPTASTVVWSDGTERLEWHQLAVRATAPKSGHVTIFLEGFVQDTCAGGIVSNPAAQRLRCDVFFDDVSLVAVQPFCLEENQPEKPPGTPPPGPTTTCVNFYDLQPSTEVPPTYEKQRFIFESMDKRPMYIVSWGMPAGRSKLALRSGVAIDLPFAAEWVQLRIYEASKTPVRVAALNAQGMVVDRGKTVPTDAVQSIELKGAGIVVVEVTGGNGEAVRLRFVRARIGRIRTLDAPLGLWNNHRGVVVSVLPDSRAPQVVRNEIRKP